MRTEYQDGHPKYDQGERLKKFSPTDNEFMPKEDLGLMKTEYNKKYPKKQGQRRKP